MSAVNDTVSNSSEKNSCVSNRNSENLTLSGPDSKRTEDNLPVDKRFDINEKQVNTDFLENVSLDRSMCDEISSTASLSKYFGNTSQGNGKTSDFFDNISTSSAINPNTLAETIVSENNQSQSVNEKSQTVAPTPLLKFFSEDKSGFDQDGKAFFDKIGLNDTPQVLEIEPNVLGTPFQDSIISCSTSTGEIEDAWIPSETTRQILVSINTSSSPIVPDRNQLTLPCVTMTDEMRDPVKELLLEFNSPQAKLRKVLSENDVSPDENGLQKLMEAGCYNAAINLTQRLLKPFTQTSDEPVRNTPFSVRLWYVRLALFVKLKQYQFAEKEIAPFGNFDKPDLYYEYYPDLHKGKKGSIVPFSFRLLAAELPQHLENPQLALDNLYYLLHTIQKMLKNVRNGCAEDGSMIELPDARRKASLEIWEHREKRVLFSILNCVMTQKDYISAVSVTRTLIAKSQADVPQLYSALGRIYLQLGDVKFAQECFSKALLESSKYPRDFQVDEKVNRALLAISHNNNEEAYKYYSEAFTLSPNNPMLANNMAVCLLYMGRLKDSLELLERTIQENPERSLHDGLIFNICTLYELESSRCPQKKLAMLEMISQRVGDAFNVGCLKIQPLKA